MSVTFAFKKLFEDSQAALKGDPDRALATFKAESRLIEGFRCAVEARQFQFSADEPEALGGTDTAPNPVEYLLAALATCQEITYRLYADALGIPLESVSVSLEGDIDLRGFLDVDDGVPPGFTAIRGTVTVDSSADDEALAKLRRIVNRHCPVLDNLRNPTPVSLRLARKAGRAAA